MMKGETTLSTKQPDKSHPDHWASNHTGTGDLQPGLASHGTKEAIWPKVTEETLLLGLRPTAEKFVAGLSVRRICPVPKL